MTVIATAGHVDHGKSTLVQALTGTDPDRFEEEKRRGLTIDLGFAQTTLPSGRAVSFVDVPGHHRFIPNMLAGVGAVDGCLFVVDVGEGWRAQSEEHLRILELLGIGGGVIALTKTDAIDVGDDDDAELRQLAIDVCAETVAEQVAGSPLAGAPMVAVSSHTGEGLDELRQHLDDYLDAIDPRPDTGRPRLWVDRSFAAKGSGTVVTGTSTGGSFAVDDRVVIEPGGRVARIRSIQSHGKTHEQIEPGHRVALNLTGVSHHDVVRGDVVVTPDRWHLTDTADAELRVLSSLDHDVSRRGAFHAYIGSGDHLAKVRVLGSDEQLTPGQRGRVRLHLPTALPLLPGDRYVLRESGRDETIGGGEILDVSPVLPAPKAAPDRRWQRVVDERGWVTVDELERLTGERVDGVIGHWVVNAAVVDETTSDILSRVGSAGVSGLPLAALDERQRAIVATLDDLIVEHDVVRSVADAAADALAEHPVIGELAAAGVNPPDPTADRTILRQLQQRGVLVERDGIWFHHTAIDIALDAVKALLADAPDGFTVAEFRERLGTTRKYAMPLLAELDHRGLTRRRDQMRIAGRRLQVDGSPDGEPSP